MIRDRTNLYLSYRQSYPHHPKAAGGTGAFANPIDGYSEGGIPEEQQGLMNQDYGPLNAQDDYAIEMDILPPTWMDISGQVELILTEIKDKMKELESYHKKNMLPGFDDRTYEEEQIEQLTFEITSELHKCQSLIRQLSDITKTETDLAEQKMSTNMKIALATKVQEVSSAFRKMQSSYLKALKNDAFPSADIPFAGTSFNGIDRKGSPSPYGQSTQPTDEELDIALSQSTLQQSSMLATSEDANLRQREHEITKLAQGILELAAIFKDLQSMVIDQGTLLDRIDYNVETMFTNVKHADKQLVKASTYQRSTQKCKVILLLILIILALIIVLIVKPKGHSSSPSPAPAPAPPANPGTGDSDTSNPGSGAPAGSNP